MQLANQQLVSFDHAMTWVLILGGLLIALAIAFGLAMDSRAKAKQQLWDSKKEAGERRDSNMLFMWVINELRGIEGSKQHEAIPDERICEDLAWVFTISWEHDDFSLRVHVSHSANTRATICYSTGGRDMPEYVFGPGQPGIRSVPACVRQILGIPEPPLQKSVGMSS